MSPIINDTLSIEQLHLQPDLQMTEHFLTLISQGDESFFAFQTFADKKDGKTFPQIFFGAFEEHKQTLFELNQREIGIFVAINKTDGKGRKTENITDIRAVFVDLDGSPLEPILQAPLQPHIVIESSPGRYHAYWIIEGLPLDEFTLTQKLLAERFYGDPQICDLSRVMRLPGFYHHKGTPHLTKIIMESGQQPISKELFAETMQLSLKPAIVAVESEDLILNRLKEYGLLIKKAMHPSRCWIIRCPWSALHSNTDNEAKYFESDKLDYPLGGFHCFHVHCKNRTLKDLKEFLGLQVIIKREPLPLHRPLTDPPPFPFNALGNILQPAALALQRVIQAPDAICAQSVLGATSLATQPYANVSIDGRKYPLSLFLITVAESGDRKSATDKLALKPLYDWQKMLCNTYRSEIAQFRIESELWEAQKREWLKKSAPNGLVTGFALPPPIAPLHPLMLVEEPTYEGIVKYLDIGQPSIGLFSDEGGRFFGGHAMSRDNQIKTIAGLSSLWDGKEISRMRGGDGSVILYGRRLSLHLMIQEFILEKLMSNRVVEYQGFLPRCLISYPISTAGNRPYVEKDLNHDPDLNRYWGQINSLLDKKLPIEPLPAPQNELHPADLELTLSAKNHWIDFHNAIDKDLIPGKRLEPIRRFANKAAEHVFRIAGILSIIENIEVTQIESKHIEAAIVMIEYYLSEALRIQGCLAIHPDILLAKKLLGWCGAKGKETVSLKEIYHKGPTEIRQAKKARIIMSILEEHGWATPLPDAIIDEKPCKEAWRISSEA